MPEHQLLALEALCRAKRVKLLAVRSYGLMGSMRASLGEHCVVESKPDAQVDDLRIARAWPALRAFAASFDLDALDDGAHRHVPYAVLLLRALEAWRAARRGAGGGSGAGGGASSGVDGKGGGGAGGGEGGDEDGAVPSTAAERAEFKRIVAGMRRTGPEGVPMDVS